MSIQIIQNRLDKYDCKSTLEEEQALREITQEIALAALGRTNFFKKAAFQGGTCLRIFYGLNRFSEDLDFALQEPDDSFVLKPYLDSLVKELVAYGYELEVEDRPKPDRAVRAAFIKDDSIGRLLTLHYKTTNGPSRKLRIKLEVDSNPPSQASFETKYLDFPFPSAICLYDPASLFAGKLHALLCRNYVKGRDWYDFTWYISQQTPLNYQHLSKALNQLGPWQDCEIQANRQWCMEQLQIKIQNIDWAQTREDIRNFIKPNEQISLDLWSSDFFLAQLAKLI